MKAYLQEVKCLPSTLTWNQFSLCRSHAPFPVLVLGESRFTIPLFKAIKPSLDCVCRFLPPLGKAHNVRFFLAGVECRPLHKDPPPVLHRPRAQPAAGHPDAEAEAATVGDGDAAASRFGTAVELLLDHLVEKPARKG